MVDVEWVLLSEKDNWGMEHDRRSKRIFHENAKNSQGVDP